MKKIILDRKRNLFSPKKNNPIKIIPNNLKLSIPNTKFQEKIEEEKMEKNKEEVNKIFIRLNNIFISKTNCSKFNYHPLINYSIGKMGEYSLYLKTIFVEISYYKKGKLKKKEITYFNPYSTSFCVNFHNLTFIFYMLNNKVQIFVNLKEYFTMTALPDIKNIKRNCIDLNNINNKNNEYSYRLNNTFINDNKKLKNPFEDLKEKVIGFSCKKNDDFYEIKYGLNKIDLDGFYEARNDIKLSFNYPKFIFIKKGSFIFLEIKINCDVDFIKEEIIKKIQILKLLGLTNDDVFYLGIIHNNKITNNNINNNINENNNNDNDNYIKTNNEKENENEEIHFKDNNFNIYIFNCDTSFLGQKINLIQRICSQKFDNSEDEILNNTQLNNKIINIRNLSQEKVNTRNMVLKIQNTENLSEIQKYTGKKNLKQTFEIKKRNIQNIQKLPSISISNFSLFDDDILYSQMNFD